METIRPEQLKALNIPINGQVPVYNSATEQFEWINASGVTSSGGGDMFKSVYDVNDNGIVDNAESAITVAWTGISGKPISDAQITDLTDGGTTILHTHATTSGTNPGFAWFNVKEYGALGDGTTDDTAAVQATLDAIVTASGGVLYWPRGKYLTDGGFSFTVPITVVGDGSSAYFDEDVNSNAVTTIICTSETNSLFTVNSWGCNFRDFVARCTGASPSAGAGIKVNNGDLVHFNNLNIQSFYDDISILDGAEWFMDGCHLYEPVRYALSIAHTDFSGDFGDMMISNSFFMPGDRNSTAAIYWTSGGGLKIINCKINGWYSAPPVGTAFTYGIRIATGATINTSVLLIANTSIENVTTNGIYITTDSGRPSGFKYIVFTGLEFGMYGATGNPIKIDADTAGDITYVTIGDCVFVHDDASALACIDLTNAQNVKISNISYLNYAEIVSQTGCSDIQIMDGAKLDDWQLPDDNTDLNATQSYHGLFPKLSGNEFEFLNGLGNWITVSGYVYSGTPGITQAYVKELIHDEVLLSNKIVAVNIPQTYDHLEVLFLGAGDNASEGCTMLMQVNGDTTASDYRMAYHYYNGATHDVGNADGPYIFPIAAANAPSGSTGWGNAFIPFYRATTNKNRVATGRGYSRVTATTMKLQEITWEWENTDAIDLLTFRPDVGTNLLAGSRLQVFGMVEKAQGGAIYFTDLLDVPSDYTGHAYQIPQVNASGTGLEFVTVSGMGLTFLDLEDTPDTYTGNAGKVPVVNDVENALEFIAVSGIVIPYPRNTFHFFCEFSPAAGTWTTHTLGVSLTETEGAGIDPFNAIWYQNIPATQDAADIDIILEAGTYDFTVWGRKSINLGNLDWSMDGTNFATAENWYADPPEYGTTFTGTVTVVGNGHHTLMCTVNGKHASSSNYYWMLTAIQLIKQ
jgi:hypothetical protein